DIDYDLHGVAVAALAEAMGYPHWFARRPNRGLPSHRDLDGNGRIGGPRDAEGFADFAGQGGLAVLSHLPIVADEARDFSAFAWADLPGHLMVETLPKGENPTRLSTTAHWDVPILRPSGQTLHILAWHATAPVFDGPEDRNGRRNHDEAAFWLHYLEGNLTHAPPIDYVLLGAANADPHDGESRPQALNQLRAFAQDPRPTSRGGAAAANAFHKGPPVLDTVDWEDGPNRPGNLRVDYVLPAKHLNVTASGVFWPDPNDPLAETAATASRHRLVWADIVLP
ncbi:MAG: endonuclease/exonuclease/phosphatase family protein, partial [Pseudomonadota bacterium]